MLTCSPSSQAWRALQAAVRPAVIRRNPPNACPTEQSMLSTTCKVKGMMPASQGKQLGVNARAC